jgi:hypothetical protein
MPWASYRETLKLDRKLWGTRRELSSVMKKTRPDYCERYNPVKFSPQASEPVSFR